MFEIGHRAQGEYLRVNAGFQIQYHADGVGIKLAYAHAGDIRIQRQHFLRQGLQYAVEAGALNVHHQPVGIG